MNILLLTDSLGYPRTESDYNASGVWTYKLRDMFSKDDNIKFFFDIKTGRETRSLLFDMKKHIASYPADIVVLQVGIVDCYPRALSRLESQVLPRIPLLNKVTKKIVEKFYSLIVKMRKISYVNKKDFLENLIEIRNLLPDAHWVVIPIAPANNYYCQKNPLVYDAIKSYNLLLKEVFLEEYADDLYNGADVERLFGSDGHHLSKYGHETLCDSIFKQLLPLIKK